MYMDCTRVESADPPQDSGDICMHRPYTHTTYCGTHIQTHTFTRIHTCTYYIHRLTCAHAYTQAAATFWGCQHARSESRTHTHIHTHTYTYIYIHTHIHTSICDILGLSTRSQWFRTHTHIHAHTYTYIYIHIHTYTQAAATCWGCQRARSELSKIDQRL